MNTTSKVAEALESMSHRELGDVKVLVVEDDLMISDLISTKLNQSGCIPYSVNNGTEAIAMATQFQPHVIILDLMLPGRSGEEILTDLKTSSDLAHIPVIIFTNKSAEDNEPALMKAGADRYFVKSSTELNDLISSIKELAKK